MVQVSTGQTSSQGTLCPLPLRAAAQLARDSGHRDCVTANELGWTQWQEAVVSTTMGSCHGSLKWAGIQQTLAMLCTQLAAFNTARRRAYRGHPLPVAHQRNWQPPPMQRPSPLSLRPVPSRSSRLGHSIRPVHPSADLTCSTNLTALSQCAQPEEDTASLADFQCS